MAKTGSPLAYGILGLLSGLGQGLMQHQEQQRKDIKDQTKRQQDVQDIQSQQAFQSEQTAKNVAAEDRRTQAEKDVAAGRTAEDVRHNKAVEDANTKMQDQQNKYENAQQDLQNRMAALALQNQGLQNLLEIVRTTNGKDPASESRKFISDTYQSLIKEPRFKGDPNSKEFQSAMKAVSLQALQTYKTTGSDILDKSLIDEINKTLPATTGNKGAATQNQPKEVTGPGQTDWLSGLLSGAQPGINSAVGKAVNFFNPFPDYINQPRGADLGETIAQGARVVGKKQQPYGPKPLRTQK